MKAIEIIKETIKYYTTDPNRRAIGGQGECLYNTADGRHCAIGRCLTKKYRDAGWELNGNLEGLDTLVEENLGNSPGNDLDDMLMPRYRGQTFEFWMSLQSFHDRERNWNKNGLTEKGIDHMYELKGYYNEL